LLSYIHLYVIKTPFSLGKKINSADCALLCFCGIPSLLLFIIYNPIENNTDVANITMHVIRDREDLKEEESTSEGDSI